MKARIAVFLTLLFLVAAALLAAQAVSLDHVLGKMDAAAVNFTSAQGVITYTKVTVIVNDKSVEKGQFFFERGPRKSPPDLRVRINFTPPSERMILLKGEEVQIYHPKNKLVDIWDLGKNRAALDQFLLLGFGSSGRDLQSAYTVSLGGDVTVNGEDVVRLDLKPKSDNVARQIQSVQLFLSKKTWQPVQQIFTEPSGDYLQAEYGSLKTNAPLPKGAFDLNPPKNVKKVHH